MKITVGEVIDRLQQEIQENPYLKDAIITEVNSTFWTNIENDHTPDNNLRSFDFRCANVYDNVVLMTVICFDEIKNDIRKDEQI